MKIMSFQNKKSTALFQKLILNRITAPFAMVALYAFLWIFKKNRIFRNGIFNKKWDTVPDSDEYHIYLGYATVLMKYHIPHLLTHDKPSYLFAMRQGTVDTSKLPSRVYSLSDSSSPKSYVSSFTGRFALYRLIKKLSKRVRDNPKTKIHLHTSIASLFWDIHPFIKYKIPESNYSAYGIEEVFDMHQHINAYMSDVNTWKSKFEEFSKDFNALKKSYLPVVPGWQLASDMSPYMCFLYDNIRIVLTMFDLDCMPKPAKELEGELAKMQIVYTPPQELISSLSQSRLSAYYDIFGIDKIYYDDLFNSTSKPPLIITSGYSVMEDEVKFSSVAEEIFETYGSDFRIFYKPHPAKSKEPDISKDVRAFLDKHNIPILPCNTPIEIVLDLYPNVSVGGYKSTFYLFVTGPRVKFFITKSFKVEDLKNTKPWSTGVAMTYWAFFRILEDLYNDGVYPEAKIFSGE